MTAKEMTAKEMIEVMQAYKNGKQIQAFDEHDEKWVTIANPSWNFGFNTYRIRPEEPTYRPYKSSEEMIADYKARFRINNPDYTMPLIWIQTCISHNAYLVNAFPKESDHIKVSDFCIYFERLLEDYTYLDGSPCGKLVEE